MEIIIQPLNNKDLQEVKELYFNTIQEVCSGEYSQEERDAWSSTWNTSSRWEIAAAEQYFVIARTGNKIVGFATLKDNNYIDFFYVHSRFQRMGIASLLYSDIEKRAKANNSTFLFSDISKTAKPFFEKMGFNVIRQQSHLKNNVELINFRMEKMIPDS